MVDWMSSLTVWLGDLIVWLVCWFDLSVFVDWLGWVVDLIVYVVWQICWFWNCACLFDWLMDGADWLIWLIDWLIWIEWFIVFWIGLFEIDLIDWCVGWLIGLGWFGLIEWLPDCLDCQIGWLNWLNWLNVLSDWLIDWFVLAVW